MLTIYNLFNYNTKRCKKNTALIFEGNHISYEELSKRVNCVAYGLKESGIKKGERVGLLYRNSDTFVVLFYAIQKLGAVAVLLNWRHNADELEQLINLTECKCLIYQNQFSDTVAEIKPWLTTVQTYIHSGTIDNKKEIRLDHLFHNHMENWEYEAKLDDEDEALVFFTSGTTGLSKAAVHTQRGLKNWVSLQIASEWIIRSNDTVLCYSPLFHLGGMQIILHTISSAGCMVILDSFKLDELLQLIEKERVTQLVLIPPSIIKKLSEAALINRVDLSSVQIAILIGGGNSEEIIRTVFDLFPNASYMHSYGHSENCGTCTMVMNKEQSDKYSKRRLSVGRMVACSEIKLLDENGNQVKVGEPGYAWAKSPAMMKGYIKKDSFVDGWFDTGDIMRQDEDGYFYFVDRVKNMIKTGGENVYPAEVEQVLNAHPAVFDCQVFGVPDSCYGEMIACAIVLKRGQKATEKEIIDYCKRKIASYKKPRKVFFYKEFPVTALGKVKKNEIREQVISQKEFMLEHSCS